LHRVLKEGNGSATDTILREFVYDSETSYPTGVSMAEGVEPATINHDLRVLRRMMRLAKRKRLISRNPFLEVDFLKQRNLRAPRIVTFDEEEKILAAMS
jgi:hypothetical protein